MANRGRPDIYDITDHKKCQDCKYWYSYADMCGYLLMKGHSRTIDNRRPKLPKGMCDSYVKTDGKRRESFNEGI